MSVTGIGSRSSLIVQSLVDMRASSTTCSASSAPARSRTPMPASASIAVSRSGCARTCRRSTRFDNTITNVGVRLDLAQNTLGRLGDIAHTVKASRLPANQRRQQRADHRPDRPPIRISARFSACSTPRPATAICSPAAAPTSRRSRPSITS